MGYKYPIVGVMQTTIRAAIIRSIGDFLAESGMSERAFGLAVNGNHKFVKRLRDGDGVTLGSIENAERVMRHWRRRARRTKRNMAA